MPVSHPGNGQGDDPSVYLDNALKHGCTSTAISSTGISNDDPSATKAPISEGHIKLAKDAADP
ncbi:MAG: hypothetical protein CME01_01460 [Geminicoccus sp.]|nr:hypothetical protein [Geminicoccus sp.]